MFPFEKTFPTPAEHRPGKNTCEFIVLHHTGTGKDTRDGVIDGLYRRADYASCHFLVDWEGKAYKFGDPTDILFHAGVSQWGTKTDMNRFAIGIEILGPDPKLGFNDAQRKTVRDLVQHLMAAFDIPAENVLRHADLTHAHSQEKVLWDGKSPSRKVDVSDLFWKIDRRLFAEYQRSLKPKLHG